MTFPASIAGAVFDDGLQLQFLPLPRIQLKRIGRRFGQLGHCLSEQEIVQHRGGLSLAVADAVGAASVLVVAMLTILVGLGSSLAVPTLTTLLVDGTPAELAGTVLSTSRQLGGALAVAVFGALVAWRATFLHGMHISLGIAAVLLLATAGASLTLAGHYRARALQADQLEPAA